MSNQKKIIGFSRTSGVGITRDRVGRIAPLIGTRNMRKIKRTAGAMVFVRSTGKKDFVK